MPKGGHGPDEYEDAFAGVPAAGRFAVADGASESSFARTWADLLVHGFTAHTGPWSRWLPAARQSWQEAIQDRTFSWYAEDKFLQGAHATFLGVSIQEANLRWRAVAIGDSCLFQVRDHRLLRAFPMRRSGAFGNQPDLIGSRKSSKKVRRLHWHADWQKEDRLLLMTDAMAQWFLKQTENHRQPWEDVLSVATQTDFESWISTLRESNELRNDDVTVMIVG